MVLACCDKKWYLQGDNSDGRNLNSVDVHPSYISYWIPLTWGRSLIWFTVTFVPFSQWKYMLMTRRSWLFMVLYRCVETTVCIYVLVCWFYDCMLTVFGNGQHYIKLSELEKNRKLNDLLDALDFNQVVIFVKSVSRAAELNKLLVECNFPSICIHSGMSQEERFAFFKIFIYCYNCFHLSAFS